MNGIDQKPGWTLLLLLACLLPFALSALLNKGFLASDEYWTSIIHYIPAQTSSLATLVSSDDVKAPTQNLPMHLAAQFALGLGATHPFAQYGWVVLLCGLLNSVLIFLALERWRRVKSESPWLLVGFVFYLASPVLFTRPMFEVMSAPWLLWAAVMAWEYDHHPKMRSLLLGSTGAALAFLLRPQTGICALVFVILPILHRRWKDLAILAAWGLGLLLLSGLPDLFLRGSWHYSLISLVRYNAEHGAEYGRQPWWYYFPVLFLLSFAPWWMFHLRGKKVGELLFGLRSLFVMVILFIGEHMLFAQKFERFLFPILPILYLITWDFLVRSGIWQKRSWRPISLASLNLIFWGAAVFSVPQQNLLEMSQYVDQHRDIQEIWSFDESLSWLPDVLADRPAVKIRESKDEGDTFQHLSCPKYILVRESQTVQAQPLLGGLSPLAHFSTGILDQWAYKLNRSHNIRRAPAVLYGCP